MRVKTLFIRGIVTKEQVVTIYREALSLLSKSGGKTVMQWQSTDVSNSLQFALPVEDVIFHCDRFLRRNWPDEFGPLITRSSNDYRFS